MSECRPTILYLVTEDWYFVSHRLALAEAAIGAGFRVVVATRVQEHGDVLRAAGCEVRALGWRRSGNTPLDHWKALREILRVYRDVRPDLAHHVALKPVVFGALAARAAGVTRVISAVAGLGFVFSSDSVRARVLRPLLRRLLRFTLRGEQHRVIVQNRDDRETVVLGGLAPSDRVVLIRGAGVPTEVFHPGEPAAGPPIVVLVARLLWDKGVGEFVRAAGSLRAGGVAARFRLIGAPDPDNPAAIPGSQLEAWRASGVVECLGHRDDIARLLRESTIFCLPTRYGEGIPRSLLEAAATGLGLVVTDSPGCREVVRHRETGLLVPPGDQLVLETALTELLANPGLRARLGAAARALMEREFALPKVISETLAIYRELLG
ncbi:MAG: glycosyltransferase family 4 protein [Gemmatimonadales bacterium]